MFLKHPAWLWLKKYDKSKLPPPDANLQALFDAGHDFEKFAEQFFPEATRLGFDNYQEYMNLLILSLLVIDLSQQLLMMVDKAGPYSTKVLHVIASTFTVLKSVGPAV